jgi:valyl-tRNA synthetase
MAEDGSKMSKSVGNVVDPIPLIDQYGSDAVRIGLIIGRTAGVNRGFDLRKIEEGRNFANKLWNIGRFIESKNDLGSLASTDYQPKSIHDYWIINKLSGAIQDVSKLLDEFRYSEAYEVIYHFIWDDFADWYIEASKSEINLSVLNYCFRQILILVHPFAPFVTEAIWNSLNWSSKGMLITSSWPKVTADNSDDLEFEKIINTVEEIRFVRSILGNENKINLIASDQFIIKQEKLLKNLAKINSLKKSEESRGLKLQSSAGLWLDISDTEISNFINTLDNQLHGSELLVKNLSSRLSNKSYLEKAPKQIVDETRSDLENAKKILDALSIQIKNFKAK